MACCIRNSLLLPGLLTQYSCLTLNSLCPRSHQVTLYVGVGCDCLDTEHSTMQVAQELLTQEAGDFRHSVLELTIFIRLRKQSSQQTCLAELRGYLQKCTVTS